MELIRDFGHFGFLEDENTNWKRNFKQSNMLKSQILIMQFLGGWPIPYEDFLPEFLIWLSSPLNKLYFLFVDFNSLHIFFMYFITVLILFQTETATIVDIAEAGTQAIIYAYTFFGTYYFQYKHTDCKNLFDYINNNFRMRSARGLTYVTTEPTHQRSRWLSVFWTLAVAIGTVHLAAYPLYVGVRKLPLPCWYPFDAMISPYFEIVYVLQTIAQFQVALAFCNAGSVLFSSVFLLCGQFDILFCNLKNIRYTAMLNRGDRLDELRTIQLAIRIGEEELNQYYYSYEQLEDLDDPDLIEDSIKQVLPKWRRNLKRPTDTYLMDLNDELMDILTAYIQHHQTILKFATMLEDFYNPIILIKSLQITLQICSLAYVASKTRSNIMLNFNKLEYLFLTLLELFLFGYVGNWLKYQSTRVGDALLRCPWYLCGGPFRRGILMLLSNTLKPLVITGGKFFIMDFDKVKGIMTASFSYYTLLQKLSK